ncbi:N-acetyltransferase [Schizosaccharomyces pombe]|uniref:Uncharacterized N-acetyltransferase C1271.07c n=1 Tax=Schizosaccharomyces pombe (strain 972 / ATCC 24843) TaxID=284812 RepID=YHM7_SCHPO|nr:putative N-acetyltransferase [Schizosaccharomyces pombe]O94340.1 RecName: Full=Uncharacterized N-acetyltransferase C1271.07c [Schizosaccharomyces pombe 972h-]CAA22197.1 N-acetyltransferase (predicted) [Schizosaccharomyces pombe]|eukprot:NP_595143.1 putative N-acetyltransferase [Schizosaccharomyces pombe]
MMKPSNISISAVKLPQDLDDFKMLVQEYLQEFGMDLTFQNVDDELANPMRKYGPPHGIMLVARDEHGTALGCVAVHPFGGPGCCEMKRLYVRPESRGLKLGVLLVKEIIQYSEKLGYSSMVLDTLDTLLPAVRLYKSFGFKTTEPYYHNPIPNVVYMRLEMSK